MSANSQQEVPLFSVFRSYNSLNNVSAIIPFPNYNETICFGSNSKNYMDIIYNSDVRKTLTLSIEELTGDSTKSRIALKNMKLGMIKKIPRPQNAWIIYRRDKHEYLKILKIRKSSVASVKISEMWKAEPNEVKEYFSALSMLALDKHRKKYGDSYKYQPRSSSKRVSKKKQKQAKENISMIPTPATSNQQSPVETSMSSPPNNDEYPTPATTVTSEEDANIEFECMMTRFAFPSCSDITTMNQHHLSSEEISSLDIDFIRNASMLATYPSQFTTTTKDAIAPPDDFQLYSEDENESPVDNPLLDEHFSNASMLTYPPLLAVDPLLDEHFLNAIESQLDKLTQESPEYPVAPEENQPLIPEISLTEPENQHMPIQYARNEESTHNIFLSDTIDIEWQFNDLLCEDQMDFFSQHPSL